MRRSAVAVIFVLGMLHVETASGEVSIDAEAGIIKGLATGMNFDAKGGVLYNADSVLRSGVAFNEILNDCELVAGGQVCINPVSGTYGLLDETGYYICEEFFVPSKDSFYEPNTGKWLPSDLGPLVSELVQAGESEAERRLFSGWKLYRGPIEPLAIRLASEKPAISLWRIFQPKMGIPAIARPPATEEYAEYMDSLPKELSGDALRSRFEKHCNVPAYYPFDGASGFEYEAQLREFLATKLTKRQQVVDKINAALIREGKGRKLNWSRAGLESGWLTFVDNLENWHVLYQENAGTISAIGVVNFRPVGSATQIDWLVASLRVADPIDINGDPGHSFETKAYADYASLANLYRLAYSSACAGVGE